MNTVERYNQLLHTSESGTVTMLNRVLDAGFMRLLRRARIHMKAGYTDPAQRNLALLQEFRQLIPIFRPDRLDAYDRILRNLVGISSRYGLTVADELTGQVKTGPRVDVSIPLEATVAAAAQAKGYLRKHGEKFAETAAFTVAQGVAEGRPTDAMVQDLRQRLGVVKSRAETIVRTESLRAYSEASNNYYSAQGIELVSFYVGADDRACPICSIRAGKIYKRSELRLPLHPRCRCYAAPFSEDLASIDPDYLKALERHRTEVEKATGSPLSDDLVRSVFETRAPVPVTL